MFISFPSLALFPTRRARKMSMEIEGASGGSSSAVDLEKGIESSGGRDAIYLVWEDLTVVLPNFGKGPTKRLLNGITGFAEPGRIMAIMGPSGSGKSTLLDSLAGRLSGNVIMTGNVLINGRKRRLDSGVAYVTQEDALLGTLTVRETITYSAKLRLPGGSRMTKDEVTGLVEETITEMGLEDCADHLVGDGGWRRLRGISGGEKKRLSIALEILTRPRLLFLDEPTTGLDSASAFFVTLILKNLARCGTTVVSSVHQPSSQVFAVFDDLFLISAGETVFFGEAKMAVEFFADFGFPCPSRRNPSDHFLRCINTDFDNVTVTLLESHRIHNSSSPMTNLASAEIKDKLVEKYKASNYAMRARARIREISAMKGLAMVTKTERQASWWKQLTTLTKRSFVNMSRDSGYYWIRIFTYIAVSICVGTVFFDVGTSYSSIMARGSCGGFISGYMLFMSIGGFPSFIEEMKIFNRERLNRHYGVGVFIVSNLVSSIPFLMVMSLSTATITYFMVKLRPGFSHFAFAWLDLMISIAVVESTMMLVASLVPNLLMGLVTGAGIIGIMMLSAGFFRFLGDLPKPFWRYPLYYVNFMAWALQGEYKNDLMGMEFEPQQPGDPKLKGEFIIKSVLGISLDRSKWWDLTAVIIILIVYRLLFFVVLKFKERASPVFRKLYTKRTLHHLSKRPSFRKTPPPFPSSHRHRALPSLSSQEGLNSPCHSIN